MASTVELVDETCMLHPCMHGDKFLEHEQISEILLEYFKNKIHAICKTLQELTCNMENSYKIFMENIEEASQNLVSRINSSTASQTAVLIVIAIFTNYKLSST